ncbi:hypothetical protein ACQPZ8_20140 [Actinomadura nitritigenes]|uniref:hypothetical protein n=1 Tax=Actinomadura nitritigenes TaxID=134602 RepID=UPI003D8EB3EE
MAGTVSRSIDVSTPHRMDGVREYALPSELRGRGLGQPADGELHSRVRGFGPLVHDPHVRAYLQARIDRETTGPVAAGCSLG